MSLRRWKTPSAPPEADHLPRWGGEGAQVQSWDAMQVGLYSGMLSHREFRELTRATPRAKARAKELRDQLTPPEAMLWSLLKGNQLDGIAFRSQHPVGPYIVDFYCHRARLVIEADGSTHKGDQIHHDRNRDAWMRERGIHILRIPAREVLQNLSGVHATIRQITHQRIKELSRAP